MLIKKILLAGKNYKCVILEVKKLKQYISSSCEIIDVHSVNKPLDEKEGREK